MLLGILFKLGAVALSILISFSTWSDTIFERFSPATIKDNVVYDLIIVGGGSAGSTVAGRLAENGFNVLLLEAGGAPPWWSTLGTINIPIFGPMWQRTHLDWAYVTEPQDYSCGALKNKASLWPRGRVLGGSGRLNNMVYLRGHEKDWQNWGFSHSSQLYYFKKSERQLGCYRNDTYNHNSHGWLPVSDMPMTTSLSDAFLRAGQELNYYVGDLNTMTETGFMKLQTTTMNGARFSADSAFLYSKKLPNLHVVSHALVSKVVIDGENSAKAVKFYHQHSWHYARSKHGVVLSAGAIGSPKILLQSGIGPADHLLDVGIPVKVTSPFVGHNLQDHASTGSDLVLLNSSLSLNMMNLAHPESFWQYFTTGIGPLTHGGCEATALLHSKFSDPSESPPDIQLLVLPIGQSFDGGSLLRHNMGLGDKVWDEYFSKTDSKLATSVTILIVLLHPWSRGELKLKSKDPFQAPLINPRYLSDPRDVEVLVEGILKVKDLLKTEAMSQIGAYLNPNHMPGCEEYVFDSRDYWRCYTRMLTYTVYHPAGTCQMGPKDKAVVDNSFRVYGTSNLYVVDASVMPTLPSANINAPVIALAERAADNLLRTIRTRQQQTPQLTYYSVMMQLLKRKLCSESVNTTAL